MSDDVYHEMFVHVVWHTKESHRFIVPQMEPTLYDFIRRRALEPGGIFVHGIGGTDTHVHMVARIRPTFAPAEWIGKIKGGAAHDVNQKWPKSLQWQAGYGLLTFGEKDLPWVVEYVRNQKEHHRAGRVSDRLERIIEDEKNRGSSQEDKPPEGG